MSVEPGPEKSIYQCVFCRETGFDVVCGVVQSEPLIFILICFALQ